MKNLLFPVLVGLLLFSCNKEDTQTPSQTFNIQVIDADDFPIGGVEIYLGHPVGGSYEIGNARGTTDSDGKLTLTTNYDPDLLQAILDNENWDDSFFIRS